MLPTVVVIRGGVSGLQALLVWICPACILSPACLNTFSLIAGESALRHVVMCCRSSACCAGVVSSNQRSRGLSRFIEDANMLERACFSRESVALRERVLASRFARVCAVASPSFLPMRLLRLPLYLLSFLALYEDIFLFLLFFIFAFSSSPCAASVLLGASAYRYASVFDLLRSPFFSLVFSCEKVLCLSTRTILPTRIAACCC